MRALDARTAANRKNARKSTGPITTEGKARSRANAFQHGLAGQGVAWPGEEQAEVDAFVKVHVELERPQDEREVFLAARAAVLGWQILRADRIEAANAHARGSRGKQAELERRDREVEALVDRIAAEPHRAVRSLLRTAEGCEWVLAALRGFLESASEGALEPERHPLLDALILPPLPGLARVSRARALAEALRGDHQRVWPQGVPGLDPLADDAPQDERDAFESLRDEIVRTHRPLWLAELREILGDRIAEVEALLDDHLAEPDPALELAELTASFDDSTAGERIRRYQRANLRERRIALLELRDWRDGREERESQPEVQIEVEAQVQAPPEPTPEPPPADEPPAEPAQPSGVVQSSESNVHNQASDRKELAVNWLRSAPGLIVPAGAVRLTP